MTTAIFTHCRLERARCLILLKRIPDGFNFSGLPVISLNYAEASVVNIFMHPAPRTASVCLANIGRSLACDYSG